MKDINTFKAAHTNAAIAAVFNDADNSAAGFLARLMEQGIATRSEANPYALTWASAKYGCPLNADGQRGIGLDSKHAKYAAAAKAKNRVLNRIFNDEIVTPPTSKHTDNVAKLLKQFEKLTPAQRKKFLAAI